MPRRDFLPGADAALLAYSDNFGRLINDSPSDYGLLPAVAADYVAKQSTFGARLQTSLDPETRGERTVFLKNQAKNALVEATRQIARQIGNTISVTNDQRQALGLPVRTGGRSPIPAPKGAPILKSARVDGRTVTIELLQGASRRGKPAGVAGAMVFTFVGPVAPAGMEQWQFAGNVTRPTVDLPFGTSATGDTVHITAYWTNAKGESGPAARVLTINLPAGGAMPAAAAEPKGLKIAA